MRLPVVVMALALMSSACGTADGGGEESLSPEVLARTACSQWFQYARPAAGKEPAPEMLPLADSDGHDSAEGSDQYAELEAALHEAIHSLVPTATATALPAGQTGAASPVVERANRACDELPS